MNEKMRRLHEEQLGFFARIGADVSHEMRNVLSIVRENAGLLDDQLALAGGRKKLLDTEKLAKVAARIARQVDKGIEAMERFSRFAHAADQPTDCVDITALVETLAALARRHVQYHGGSLETELPDRPLAVTTDPFGLQYALFACLQFVQESAEQGQTLTIKLVDEGPAAVLSVSAPASGNGMSDRVAGLATAFEKLRAQVSTSCAGGAISVTLTIPVR